MKKNSLIGSVALLSLIFFVSPADAQRRDEGSRPTATGARMGVMRSGADGNTLRGDHTPRWNTGNVGARSNRVSPAARLDNVSPAARIPKPEARINNSSDPRVINRASRFNNGTNRWANGNGRWEGRRGDGGRCNNNNNGHGHRHHRHCFPRYYYSGFYPYGYGYPWGWSGYPYGGVSASVYYRDQASGYASEGDLVAQVQQELARAGYYRGAIDGVIGPRTRGAIRAYERANGIPVDGRIDRQLLETMDLA